MMPDVWLDPMEKVWMFWVREESENVTGYEPQGIEVTADIFAQIFKGVGCFLRQECTTVEDEDETVVDKSASKNGHLNCG